MTNSLLPLHRKYFNYAIVIVLILSLQQIKAQDSIPKVPEPKQTEVKDDLKQGVWGKLDVIPSIGYIWQKESFLDANVIFGDVVTDYMLIGHLGIRTGFETNFKSGSDFVIAPKVGVEASVLISCYRLSVVKYFQGSNNELRLLPEMGISIGGLLDVTYGYGIRLSKSKVSGIQNGRIGICINISEILYKETFPKRNK